MYCEHLLNKHVEKQFKSFKKGFDRVVDTPLIKVLFYNIVDVYFIRNRNYYMWE
jgi:hypothetical protein